MTRTQAEIEALRVALVQRLEDLRSVSENSASDRRPVALDQQSVERLSRVDALPMQAMANATERNRHVEIRAVEAAIQRIDESEVTCGDEVSSRRLAVDPTIPTCIRCASGGEA